MDAVFHLLLTDLYARNRAWRREAWLMSILPDVGFLLILVYCFLLPISPWDYSEALTRAPGLLFALYFSFHSLLVFVVVALAVWKLRPRMLPALSAWLLHILVDIPVHGNEFGTRILYPLIPSAYVGGVPWGEMWVSILGYCGLALAYLYAGWRERMKDGAGSGWQGDWLDRLCERTSRIAGRIRAFGLGQQD